MYCHHESYDGSGYPRGLKGEQIPILSQVMTVADSFDAMTTNRVYKSKKSIKEALVELEHCAGKQFNADVVKASAIALKDVKILKNITQRPKTELEKERFAYFYKDQVTESYNRNYLEFILSNEQNEELGLSYAYSIDLFNFSQYNKNFSWVEGDALLHKIAKTLEKISGSEFVFRMYGDDFIILTKEEFPLADRAYKIDEILEGSMVSFTHKCIDLDDLGVRDLKRLEELI